MNILLVEVPDLLRDVVRRRLAELSHWRVGELGLDALQMLSPCGGGTTAVVWARGGEAPRWEPPRRLLAPCEGLRVLRVDEPGDRAVLFEMRRTTEVLPDVGLDALLEVATRDE